MSSGFQEHANRVALEVRSRWAGELRDSGREFELDGESIDDIAAFIEENNLDLQTVTSIEEMEVGEELLLGGGAAAEFLLRRV